MGESDSSTLLVKDIVNKVLIFVNPNTTALQVAKMMKEGGISAIFIKEHEKFVGIVTDRDFAIKIAINNLPFSVPVKEIISTAIISIDHTEPISVAAKMMGAKN